MALQSTFTRSAGDLLRDAPSGYQKIEGIGSYKGVPITAGTDAEVRAQVAAIEAGQGGAQPQLSPSTVQGAGGNPMLPGGGAQPQPQTSPMDSFNKLSLGLLNSAKGLTTADLLKKRRLLQRASIDRSSAITPEDERVLSPNQQSAIRSGRTAALSSEIDQNAYELEKAEQSVDNFFKVFDSAQKISKEFADKMQAPESVIKNAQMIIQADPAKLSTVLASFNDKSKQAILQSLDYSKLAPKKKASEGFTLGKDQVRYDAQGNVIARGESSAGTGDNYDLQRALTSANTVLEDLELGEGGKLAGVFGRFQQFIPEKVMQGDQAYLYNKLGQLKQTIVLALRAKLKGQGTITDQETAMLEKASTALSRNLDIEYVKAEVEEMKNFIEFQLQGSSNIVTAPDGTLIELID